MVARSLRLEGYQVLAAAADHETGSSLWRNAFGISAGEFAAELLSRLPLPVLIAKPIGEFADRQGCSADHAGILSRALRVAELHANGTLLTSTPEVLVAPLELIDWRSLNAPPLDTDIRTIRSDGRSIFILHQAEGGYKRLQALTLIDCEFCYFCD